MLSAGCCLLLQDWLDPKLLMYCVLKNLKTDVKYGSITEAEMQRQWTIMGRRHDAMHALGS